MAINVNFNYGERGDVPATITNGNLYATTDTKELIIDIDNIRMALKEGSTLEWEPLSDSNPLTSQEASSQGFTWR